LAQSFFYDKEKKCPYCRTNLKKNFVIIGKEESSFSSNDRESIIERIIKTDEKVIIDGCGITTIKIPKDLNGTKEISTWLINRLGFSKYKEECIELTNFNLIYDDESSYEKK
jgi:hypothetical protein